MNSILPEIPLAPIIAPRRYLHKLSAHHPACPTTTSASGRKARCRGFVLRRNVVVTPTAGYSPAWAWVGDVAPTTSTAGERSFDYAQDRPLLCIPRRLYAACSNHSRADATLPKSRVQSSLARSSLSNSCCSSRRFRCSPTNTASCVCSCSSN